MQMCICAIITDPQVCEIKLNNLKGFTMQKYSFGIINEGINEAIEININQLQTFKKKY